MLVAQAQLSDESEGFPIISRHVNEPASFQTSRKHRLIIKFQLATRP